MAGGIDLETRLNCPYCKGKGTNAHYMHSCRESTVVAARRKHRALLAAAIHTCKLKNSTALALTAMYDLDDLGRHIDPGAGEKKVCEDLVDHLIGRNPKVGPARGAFIALLEMGPSERTQGWFPVPGFFVDEGSKTQDGS